MVDKPMINNGSVVVNDHEFDMPRVDMASTG